MLHYEKQTVHSEMSAVEEEKESKEVSLDEIKSTSDENDEALKATLKIIKRSRTAKKGKKRSWQNNSDECAENKQR